MSKMSSSYRAAKRKGGEDPIKGATLKSVMSRTPSPKSSAMEELKDRQYAQSPDTKETSAMESDIKSNIRKEYSQKDKDIKNAMDKSLMKSKINYLESRERKLGGKEAVTSKIKTKEKVNKALPWVAGGAVLAGVAKMIYDEKERQKKVGK